MARKYQKGEHVCYGMSGVCLIEDVREMTVAKGKDTFYVLRPLQDRHSTFYIPANNALLTEKMREPVARQKIDALLEAARADNGEWIIDRKTRMETFREILRKADPLEVLRLYALLYRQKQTLSESGKRLAPSDENVLRQAEDLTKNEFGFSMQIQSDDAAQYIAEKLNER